MLSGLLHAGAAIALIGFQAAPRVQDLPEPLAVEIVLETPAPPAPFPGPVPVTRQEPAPSPPEARKAPPPSPRPVAVSRPTKAAPSLQDTPVSSMGEALAEAAPPLAEPSSLQAAPAPPVAVAAVDYGAYVGRLHQRIAQHRIYPPQAMRRREEGDVHLRILLAGDGSLLDILNLAEASAQLTRAARQAIESAAPFDPPPRAGGGEKLAFDVTVAFRLR
jgi:protein TonB